MNPLQQLQELGQSVWLDSLRRSYLGEDGYLARLIGAGELDGLTSNPTIFQKALAEDEAYEPQLRELASTDPRDALWKVMKADVGEACDLFLPLYEASDGRKGFCSLEVDPSKAFDTEGTVSDALELFRDLGRPNLMVKVPGTEAGLPAITRLIAEGVNVNVTLLFSVRRYEAVAEAFLEGLRRSRDAGGDLSRIASVASFFVSRVDTKVDKILGDDRPRLATAGILNSRVAYGSFERIYASAGWQELADEGARPQRLLWASTSVKDDFYPDTLYVQELAGPQTVNTMPESTLDAFRDHGEVADRLTGTVTEARQQLERLAEQGVDMEVITKELESEGVEKFVDSFEDAVAEMGQQKP
jgi:transaldolase